MSSKKRNAILDRLQALNVTEPSRVTKIEVSANENSCTEKPQLQHPHLHHSEKESAKNEHPQDVDAALSGEDYKNQELTKHRHSNSEIVIHQSEVSQSGNAQNDNTKREDARKKESQIEQTQNLDSHSEGALNEKPQSKLSKRKEADFEDSCSEDIETEHPYREHSSHEEFESKVAQNVCSEHPSGFTVEELRGPPKGYFKLAHSVFWDADLRALSGDCFRLFIWMSSQAWQYPDSDGRIRAAVRWIHEATGIALATVSRSLNILKERGLIAVELTDYRNGNIWKVSPKALGKYTREKTFKKPQHDQNENPPKESAVPSKRERSTFDLRTENSQKEGNIRISKESNKKTTTLPHDAPEKLKIYFEHCKPFRKRESELQSFEGLIVDYSMQSIAEGLDYLLTRGLPATQEPCKYPMAYMSYEMPKLLEELNKLQQFEKRKKAEAKAAHMKAIEEAMADEERIQAEAAFVAEYPDQSKQQAFVNEYTSSRFTNGFRPPKDVIRSMAIQEWYECRMQKNQVSEIRSVSG